jgi:very-short-patch-repair endonuclease
MARLFVRHSLPAFEFHAVICGFEVDFLVVGTNVVFEVDGWTTHGLVRAQFERDRERDALLTEAGYVVQRFTWRQITRRPGWVAARISGLLATWAPHVLAS